MNYFASPLISSCFNTSRIPSPLHRPMRHARPYTELIENHANISIVVKGMDAKIKETERNLEVINLTFISKNINIYN